jgi:hypothetical protein
MTRTNRRLLCLLSLLTLTSGCQLMQNTRPMVVEARDAETHQPIPGAQVSLSYLQQPAGFAPSEVNASTGTDGIARMQGSVPGDAGMSLDVSANGYHSGKEGVARSTVETIPPLKMFEKNDQRPVQFVVELYAEPDPSIELVLPAGYKGEVKAQIIISPTAGAVPGQRVFSVPVSPTGSAQIAGPEVLKFVGGTDFHFRYTDGVPISRRAEGDTLMGYWFLSYNENDKISSFFVGTFQEFDDYRRTHKLPEGVSGGRQGGAMPAGHGGRHRGGNQTPPTTDGSATMN